MFNFIVFLLRYKPNAQRKNALSKNAPLSEPQFIRFFVHYQQRIKRDFFTLNVNLRPLRFYTTAIWGFLVYLTDVGIFSSAVRPAGKGGHRHFPSVLSGFSMQSMYLCNYHIPASTLMVNPSASLIFCENLYEIFKIIGYAIVTIKKRGWLYGYDLKNNCPL